MRWEINVMYDLAGSIIWRIQRMELYYDTVKRAMDTNIALVSQDSAVGEMLLTLIGYYESGQWLEDYECDERGELPAQLKRGVLSQDALYELLEELQNVIAKISGK